MRKTPTTIVLALLFTFAYSLHAQQEDTTKLKSSYFEVNDYVEDNEGCLKCHGEQKFKVEDSFGRQVTMQVYNNLKVDRDMYYSSVHKSFSCTDCHSYDLFEFPHPLDARIEEKLLCMDCHGYDETFAQYHFEDIEAEFMESAHNMDEFTCWKCHDPHSYKAFMRTATDIEDAILYDNQMCLSCHADYSQFMLLSDREEINVVESHDWLPNQIAHFRSVRCIECHTAINDSILIAHKIMPKTEAVKNCNECHAPHSYKAFMRTATDIEEAILYDNQMCLSCHADYSQFLLLSDREEINVVESHDWLPNQIAHFRSVRCIECHTAINDSILIAHKIMPKTEAVKNCNECHARDSRLMHTLYKFQIQEERKAGFANAIILNNAYVIGANQNVFMNRLSFLVFGMTLLVIVFHSYLRIRKLKNK